MRGGLFGLFGKKKDRTVVPVVGSSPANPPPASAPEPGSTQRPVPQSIPSSSFAPPPEMKAGRKRGGRKTRRGGGYAFNPDIKLSALANPMPFKSYNSCKTIKVRN